MTKLTLLYAEDDQETRENYTFVLKKYFDKIYVVNDGREALRIYHEKKPDILLVDINMPYLNGLDLVSTIRKDDLTTPIIMLTAHSEQDQLLYALNLKLETYLLKPVDDNLLKNTIRKLIKQLEIKEIIQLGDDLAWDTIHSDLLYQQQSIKLTKKEHLLIQLLSSNAGNYFSRDNLIIHIWYDELPNDSHDNKLIQLVFRLNKKIALQTNHDNPLIENSYSLGYKLRRQLSV